MEYQLRTKTKRCFQNSEEQRALNSLIDQVMIRPTEEVRDIIWELTYKPAEALWWHSDFWIGVPKEKALVIRGELINQYRKVSPKFGYQEYINPKEGEWPAEKRLRKQAKSDGVIIYEITRRVNACGISDELMKWYLKCMRKGDERKKFLSLKDIGFKEEEIPFVMSYISVIADLLDEKIRKKAYI